MPPEDTRSVSPDPNAPQTAAVADEVTPGEQKADQIAEYAGEVAGLYVHNAKSVSALSQVTQLSPIFIHLGFMLAHLFQHHAKTTASSASGGNAGK